MLLLILGIALWWASHLFRRVAPRTRAGMGQAGKGAVTAGLVLLIVLMVIGYRAADPGTIWWGPTPMLKGINNLLVLVAFYLFASSGSKNRIGTRFRHPQLTGFSLWAFAHLLVNGDLPSLVLFGGLLLWALVEIAVINRTAPWTPPAHPVPIRKEWTSALATVVVFVVVGLVHGWIGPDPFGM